MYDFHKQKLTDYINKVVHKRMPKIKRKTLMRENSLKNQVVWFEGLTEEEKIKILKYHCLELGTNCSDKLNAEYFDLTPDLTEDLDLTVEAPIVSNQDILDETVDIPENSTLPNVDLCTEIPSFISKPYENLRNRNRNSLKATPIKKSKKRVHPFNK